MFISKKFTATGATSINSLDEISNEILTWLNEQEGIFKAKNQKIQGHSILSKESDSTGDLSAVVIIHIVNAD